MVATADTTASSSLILMNGEPLIGLAAAGALLPGHRANSHVNATTIWRWIRKGARATNGEVVKLESVRVGQRWLTSREAVARFVAALTAASCEGEGPEVPPAESPPRAPSARKRRAAAASAELDGVLGR